MPNQDQSFAVAEVDTRKADAILMVLSLLVSTIGIVVWLIDDKARPGLHTASQALLIGITLIIAILSGSVLADPRRTARGWLFGFLAGAVGYALVKWLEYGGDNFSIVPAVGWTMGAGLALFGGAIANRNLYLYYLILSVSVLLNIYGFTRLSFDSLHAGDSRMESLSLHAGDSRMESLFPGMISLLCVGMLLSYLAKRRRRTKTEQIDATRTAFIFCIGGFCITAFIIWSGLILYEKDEIRSTAKGEMLTSATFMNEYISRYFDAPDIMLSRIADMVMRMGGIDKFLASQQLISAFDDLTQSLPHVIGVSIVDADGYVRYSNVSKNMGPINLADRAHFRAMKYGGETVHLGEAITSRVTGEETFTLSRAIQNADGSFAGSAIVRFDRSFIKSLFDKLHLDENGLAALVRTDGSVLVLSGNRSAIGVNWRDLPGFHDWVAQARNGTVAAGRLDDGVPQMIGLYANRDYPVVSVVARSEDAVMREWWAFVIESSVVLLTIIAATAGVGSFGLTGLRREAMLQAEASRLSSFRRALLDNAGLSIIACDDKGLITFFNKTAENLLGYQVDEVVGQMSLDSFHDRAELEARAAQVSETLGRVVRPNLDLLVICSGEVSGMEACGTSTGSDNQEWIYRRKDGSRVPVFLSLSHMAGLGEDGRDGYYIAIARDISDRYAAERALRFSEERHRAIVDNVIDGIFTINDNGTVTSLNPAAERIFGYSAEEVIGRNISMLMPQPYKVRHDHYIRRYLDHGEARIIGRGREVEGQRKDGSQFPLDLSVTQVEFLRRTMFVGVVRDLSDSKKVERLKAEFVSTVSHELRTPLTAMRGSLGLVNSGVLGDLGDEIKELTLVAEQSTDRLIRLINDILDVEKISAGEMKFEIVPVDICEIVRRVMIDLAPFAAQFHVEIASKINSDFKVMADSDRLIQVLVNLVSNAVKFSPRGETVTVSARPLPMGWVRVTVSDRGNGIPESFRAQIFRKFAQADASDSKAKGGTGLGLSIAKGLTEQMGGNIGFSSVTGQGTDFFIEMPLLDQGMSQPEAADDRRPRILHLEDDLSVRRVVFRLLADQGRVIGATTLGQAIELAQDGPIDLAIVDLGLGDGNGLSVSDYIRDSQGRIPPVIVFSADDRKRPTPPEVVATLIKSRDSEAELVALVRNILAARQTPSPSADGPEPT